MTAVPLLCLIGLLGVISLLEAHHPGARRGKERALPVAAALLGVVVLVLAVRELLELAQV